MHVGSSSAASTNINAGILPHAGKRAKNRKKLSTQAAWCQGEGADVKRLVDSNKVHDQTVRLLHAQAAPSACAQHDSGRAEGLHVIGSPRLAEQCAPDVVAPQAICVNNDACAIQRHLYPRNPVSLMASQLLKERIAELPKMMVDFHGLRLFEALRLAKQAAVVCKASGQRHVSFNTGRGNHSVNGIPVIRPAVQALMHKYQQPCRLSKANPGLLYVKLVNAGVLKSCGRPLRPVKPKTLSSGSISVKPVKRAKKPEPAGVSAKRGKLNERNRASPRVQSCKPMEIRWSPDLAEMQDEAILPLFAFWFI